MKKGGTVVPPSNFQFENDQKPMNTEKQTKNPRGRARNARARACEKKIILNKIVPIVDASPCERCDLANTSECYFCGRDPEEVY